jgi:ankyrin repeat protein
MLLKHGADISKAVNDQQVTALHHAVVGGFEEVIKLLIGAGAMVDASDQEGWTPLQDAVLYEHLSAGFC